MRDDRTILQPARAESPISHTSAHEMSPEELERIFAAPFTFAACAHYLGENGLLSPVPDLAYPSKCTAS